MKTKLLIAFILSAVCATAQTAEFKYQYENQNARRGTFKFTCDDPSLCFEADASAGYLAGANNPYVQQTANLGPIPNGNWSIYEVKNADLKTFRLKPVSDVAITQRSGFLIHGIGNEGTPESSSLGCIILAKAYREKLLAAFRRYGPIALKVTNFTTSDPPDHRGK